jgi:hypothetical protein
MIGLQIGSEWIRKCEKRSPAIYTVAAVDASLGMGKTSYPVLVAPDGKRLILTDEQLLSDFKPLKPEEAIR